jgi:hypothetical protein
MRVPRNAAVTGLLLLLTVTPLAAQGNDRWQISLGENEYVWDVRLVRLEGDSLLVSRGDSLIPVPVERISEVRLIRKSEMRLGEGASTMNALTGADDEVYDLTPLDFAERLRAIQKILLYHPADP